MSKKPAAAKIILPTEAIPPLFPPYVAIALVRGTDGLWRSERLVIHGDKVIECQATEPDMKVIACEKFRVAFARMLTGDGETP